MEIYLWCYHMVYLWCDQGNGGMYRYPCVCMVLPWSYRYIWCYHGGVPCMWYWSGLILYYSPPPPLSPQNDPGSIELSYYKDSIKKEKRRVIDLTNITGIRPTPKMGSSDHIFAIETVGRKYILKAADEDTKNIWLAKLCEFCGQGQLVFFFLLLSSSCCCFVGGYSCCVVLLLFCGQGQLVFLSLSCCYSLWACNFVEHWNVW